MGFSQMMSTVFFYFETPKVILYVVTNVLEEPLP